MKINEDDKISMEGDNNEKKKKEKKKKFDICDMNSSKS